MLTTIVLVTMALVLPFVIFVFGAVTSPGGDNHSRSFTPVSTSLSSSTSRSTNTMAPGTRNNNKNKGQSSTSAAVARPNLDKENAEEVIQQKELEIAELKRRLSDQNVNSAKKPAKDPKNRTVVGIKPLTQDQLEKEEKDAIMKAIGLHTFNSTVFLPATGDAWRKVMLEIYKRMDPRPSDDNGEADHWIHTRANIAGGKYNETRTYISGQQKKALYSYRNTHGRFPPLDKIEAIAKRTIKLTLTKEEENNPQIQAEVAANIDLFKWYWDVLIAKSIPQNTKFWEQKTKLYKKISDKRSPITPQVEAFIVVNFRNNYSYWQKFYQVKQLHPNIPTISKKPKLFQFPDLPEGQEDPTYRIVTIPPENGRLQRTVIYYDGEEWETKYSKSDAGSSVSGGWTDEGKILFVSWVGKVKAARKTRQSRAKEELIFQALRADYGVRSNNQQVEVAVRRREQANVEVGINWNEVIAEFPSEGDSEGEEEDQDDEESIHEEEEGDEEIVGEPV